MIQTDISTIKNDSPDVWDRRIGRSRQINQEMNSRTQSPYKDESRLQFSDDQEPDQPKDDVEGLVDEIDRTIQHR